AEWVAESDFEAARLQCRRLDGSDGQGRHRTPHRLLGRIRNEQVLQLLSVRIEETQIGQSRARQHAASKRTAADEQRDVDRETTWAGPTRLYRPLITKWGFRRRLLRGRRSHNQEDSGTRIERGLQPAPPLATHDSSFRACSTNLCR